MRELSPRARLLPCPPLVLLQLPFLLPLHSLAGPHPLLLCHLAAVASAAVSAVAGSFEEVSGVRVVTRRLLLVVGLVEGSIVNVNLQHCNVLLSACNGDYRLSSVLAFLAVASATFALSDSSSPCCFGRCFSCILTSVRALRAP